MTIKPEKVFDYTGRDPGMSSEVSLAFDGRDYVLTVRNACDYPRSVKIAPETASVLNDMWSDHLVKVRASSQRPPVSPPKLYAVPPSNDEAGA